MESSKAREDKEAKSQELADLELALSVPASVANSEQILQELNRYHRVISADYQERAGGCSIGIFLFLIAITGVVLSQINPFSDDDTNVLLHTIGITYAILGSIGGCCGCCYAASKPFTPDPIQENIFVDISRRRAEVNLPAFKDRDRLSKKEITETMEILDRKKAYIGLYRHPAVTKLSSNLCAMIGEYMGVNKSDIEEVHAEASRSSLTPL